MSRRRVKVCHVITDLSLGGAQLNVLDVVASVSQRHFSSTLLAGVGGELDDQACQLPQLSVRFVPALRRAMSPLSDMGALVQCKALIEDVRPDIVHTHGPKAGIIGRWAAVAARVPVRLHTYHGLVPYPTQSQWEGALITVAERVTRRATSHFVTVSDADLSVATARRFLTPARTEVIRNGIDLDRFRLAGGWSPVDRAARDRRRAELKRQLGVEPGRPLVTMVGELRAFKAPGDFLRVARLVSDRLPATRFWLVGEGQLRHALEDQRRHLDLDGLELLGHRRDVPDIWGATDVAVLTSHSEGFPRCLLEAMATGLPIVASDLPCIREVVPPSGWGLLAAPGDVAMMADRVETLLTHRDVAADRAADNVRASAALDVGSTVAAYERLYLSLVGMSSKEIPPAAALCTVRARQP